MERVKLKERSTVVTLEPRNMHSPLSTATVTRRVVYVKDSTVVENSTVNKRKAGPGRPPGALNKRTLARKTLLSLKYSSELPHEFLLRVSQGGELVHGKERIVPTFEQRMDAAKSAAPYFAPRLNSVEVIKGMSDDELDQIIEGAAAEAGLSLSLSGEGTETESKDRENTGSDESDIHGTYVTCNESQSSDK